METGVIYGVSVTRFAYILCSHPLNMKYSLCGYTLIYTRTRTRTRRRTTTPPALPTAAVAASTSTIRLGAHRYEHVGRISLLPECLLDWVGVGGWGRGR